MSETGEIIKITIDRDKCIGSGNCVFHAAGVFEQDAEGFPVVVDVNAQTKEVIEFAAAACPVAAIEVEYISKG